MKDRTEEAAMVGNEIDRDVCVWENSDSANIWTEGEVDRRDVDQVIEWWLTYRREVPGALAIRSMRRAVATCLSGPEASSVVEVEQRLHELMRQGLDFGRVLSRLPATVEERRPGRLTWKRQPKPATCWSPSERPELYRETGAFTISSRNWIPSGQRKPRFAEDVAALATPPEEFDVGSFMSGLVAQYVTDVTV